MYRLGPIIDIRGKPVNHVRLLPLSHGRCQVKQPQARSCSIIRLNFDRLSLYV